MVFYRKDIRLESLNFAEMDKEKLRVAKTSASVVQQLEPLTTNLQAWVGTGLNQLLSLPSGWLINGYLGKPAEGKLC